MTDVKQQLLDKGMAMLLRQGYHDLGLAALLESTNTPKGSFYHYFKSKEELGYAVLLHQFEVFAETGLAVLRDPMLPPLARLDEFIDWIVEGQAERGCCEGVSPCGALATEMAEQHEGFRKHVDALFERWTGQLQALFWEARPQMIDDVDTEALARFIVATLEGALFMSRVKRDVAVLEDVATGLRRFVMSHVRADERHAAAVRDLVGGTDQSVGKESGR